MKKEDPFNIPDKNVLKRRKKEAAILDLLATAGIK